MSKQGMAYEWELSRKDNERLQAENTALRAQLAAHEAAVEKAKAQGSFWEKMCQVQFDGDGMIYRGTACAIARDADVIIAVQSRELAELRTQCEFMEKREDAGNGIVIEQTAEIDRQARELARLREFERSIRAAEKAEMDYHDASQVEQDKPGGDR